MLLCSLSQALWLDDGHVPTFLLLMSGFAGLWRCEGEMEREGERGTEREGHRETEGDRQTERDRVRERARGCEPPRI